MQVNKIIHH